MMFSIRFFKTKYAGLIGMFFSLVMFMTGCQRKDEAIVLIPSGEDVAEFPSLEAVEQAAEPAGSSVTVQEPAKAEPQMIYVYVCGAVRDPGVVEVPEGSRAEEALRLVGGMTAEADPFYVNLAETVKATAEGLVNINTASAEELCALPGIGASRAADIVRYREQNGAFQTKEDIMKVSGIKQNAYDKLCDKITVQ